jgi:hypothetical protein
MTWQDEKLRFDSIPPRPRAAKEHNLSIKATSFLVALLARFNFSYGEFYLNKFLGGDTNIKGLVDNSSSGLLLLMQIVTAILSSLLLMLSVIVLYFVTGPGASTCNYRILHDNILVKPSPLY